MPVPSAEPGLVVRYEYLWRRRAEAGAESAEKDRPACVVVVLHEADGSARVMLLPITHSAPGARDIGVEIPQAVGRALGLDARRSWVIVSECNLDIWPSPDLRPLSGRQGRFHFGHLPPRLFRSIRQTFLDAYRQRRVAVVKR